MKRHAVRVTATCVDHIYEGYTASPRRVVCVYAAPDGREMRWVVPVGSDFPGIGDSVRLVYDARNSGLAKREVERPAWISLGAGWSLLAASLLMAGVLGTFVF